MCESAQGLQGGKRGSRKRRRKTGEARGCLSLSLPYSCHSPRVEVGLAWAVGASHNQSVSQGPVGQSGNRSPAGRGGAAMAGDKRQGSGSSGKPKIAAIPCPSAGRPREGNKRSLLPAAPFRLFPPSCSRPLRTRCPAPGVPRPKMGRGAHSWPRLFLGTCARSGAGTAVKGRLGCLGAARAAGTAGRSLWSLSARVRMCEIPGPKVSRGILRTLRSFLTFPFICSARRSLSNKKC